MCVIQIIKPIPEIIMKRPIILVRLLEDLLHT